MMRFIAVAAVVLVAACGAKEEAAPMTDAAVPADSMTMDSTMHMDSTAMKAADSTMTKM